MRQRLSRSCIPSARRAAVAFISCAALATAAQANLLGNGDFEAPIGAGNGGGSSGSLGPFVRFNAPNQGIPAWTLVSGSVEVFTNFDGSGGKVIDMTGLHTAFPGQGPGTLQQTFATDAGARYAVSFLMGGAATPFIKEMQVAVNGATGMAFTRVFALDTSLSPAAGTLVPQQFEFVANDSFSTIRFTSLVNSSYDGPYLDNVLVTAVPEARTWALMLGGLVGLSGWVRRAGRAAH